MTPQALFGELRTRFPDNANRPFLVVAPGRVNLIGEHTDYNEGFVLPIAIERAMDIAAAPRDDERVRVHSVLFDQTVKFTTRDVGRDEESTSGWSDYVRGVTWEFARMGHRLRGMDAVIWGDVPIAAGLSSSAALEVATALALDTANGLNTDRRELALLCQRAENEFVGVKCGIMDMFVSLMARAGHALLIDCRSLEYEHVPIPSNEVVIIVADSRVARGLRDSEYNERRAQCQQGVKILRRHLPGIRALRDVTLEDLEQYAGELPEVTYRRCRHVVTENQRVLDSVAALRAGDVTRFGELMSESHASLRDCYEVSSDELDLLVETATDVEGVLGSRLTGAGFGGCTVTLADAAAAEDVTTAMTQPRWWPPKPFPHIYASVPADGAAVLLADQRSGVSPTGGIGL